jgi:hypothetical protein
MTAVYRLVRHTVMARRLEAYLMCRGIKFRKGTTVTAFEGEDGKARDTCSHAAGIVHDFSDCSSPSHWSCCTVPQHIIGKCSISAVALEGAVAFSGAASAAGRPLLLYKQYGLPCDAVEHQISYTMLANA